MQVDGSVIALTGATSGIGLAAARLLMRRVGVLVVQGPEQEDDVRATLDSLRAAGPAELHYVTGDFTELSTVAGTAEAMVRAAGGGLDALVDNAGVPGAPDRVLTADGNERTLQINYLAMVLLTRRVAPHLRRGGRVVTVSSTTHRMADLALTDLDLGEGYSAVQAYAQSKLAIVTWSATLARALEPQGVDVVSISPGVISTGLLHAMFGAGGRDVEHGGRRIVEALEAAVPTGSYVDDGQLVPASEEARDPDVQRRLARETDRRLGSLTHARGRSGLRSGS
ncbi:SDR family NAD(P)-dependent oxidoreductase [Modestobacter sp. SYSU DS0290]